ncbi:MAG: hypothetical protein IJT50_12155 [Lentisphaeria bacterium]|nr:hypothetical protein [Lentisphaeria bacterium]
MPNRIWLFLKQDPLRPLVALAFAVVVYLHLSSEAAPYDRDFPGIKIPVQLSLESGLRPPQEPPQVEINVKAQTGFEVDVDKLPSKIHAYVPSKRLRSLGDGTYQVQVFPNDVKFPDSRFKLDKIVFPADGLLTFTLLRQDERNVAVQPIFDALPPPGVERRWEAIPDQVRITGPENVVSKLQKISSARIPFTDPPDFFEYDTDLDLPPGVTATPRKIRFRVTLVRKTSRRPMQLPAAVLVSPGSALSSVIISGPESGVEVVLRGPAAELAKLTPEQVRLFVDATEIAAPGRRQLPVRCHVRVPGITPVSMVPAELEVQFTKNTSEINKSRKEK